MLRAHGSMLIPHPPYPIPLNQKMKAIIDCNSFYCACEKLFRPEIRTSPVVVLSNNDGCIISRSDEAKKLGLDMAGPFFKAKAAIEKNGVAVFSSNYNLYGDMSKRVMDTLKTLTPHVEVYSVDEAFVLVPENENARLYQFGIAAKEKIEQWTGISVSIGIGETKVLCKVANRLAKKDKKGSSGVTVLQSEIQIREALERTSIDEVWGVGRRYAVKLKDQGITDAWQLRNMPEEWARKNLGGIVGVRLIRELNGHPCIDIQDPLENKKMIASTRMFGKPVFQLQELTEAVASYTSRAAEKLRRQWCTASFMNVFLVSNDHPFHQYQYNPETIHAFYRLPVATSHTNELIRRAVPLVAQLYRPGSRYLKAGVILSGIVPENVQQSNLFEKSPDKKVKKLMEAIDNINASISHDTVKYVSSGVKREWKMRQDFRSPRYTSAWKELKEVK